MNKDILALLPYVRISQLPRYLKRFLFLPANSRRDYFPNIDPGTHNKLREIANTVRASMRPVIFVHGVMPRSGTNFLSDALALHPDIYSNPGRLWEFPLLHIAQGADALQREFLTMFPRNGEVMVDYELLSYLASGWLLALQKQHEQQTLLLKTPHVENIGLFDSIFPNDYLIVCIRDGRDVIESSQKTFKNRRFRKTFLQSTVEWREACQAVLASSKAAARPNPNQILVHYERLVEQPEATLREILAATNLDPARYDFEALEQLPVRGSSTSKVRDELRWKPQRKPSKFNPIGRWKNWSVAKKACFKRIAGATLINAGYERDLDW